MQMDADRLFFVILRSSDVHNTAGFIFFSIAKMSFSNLFVWMYERFKNEQVLQYDCSLLLFHSVLTVQMSVDLFRCWQDYVALCWQQENAVHPLTLFYSVMRNKKNKNSPRSSQHLRLSPDRLSLRSDSVREPPCELSLAKDTASTGVNEPDLRPKHRTFQAEIGLMSHSRLHKSINYNLLLPSHSLRPPTPVQRQQQRWKSDFIYALWL